MIWNDKIRALREDNDLKQKDLAEKLLNLFYLFKDYQ